MSLDRTFADHFADLPDPRIDRQKRHLLLDILVIAVCALLCGAEGWEDMQQFGQAKQTWFQERLGLALPNGIPTDDTFRRVFARLNPERFQQCFLSWTQALSAHTQGEFIALDGKTLRRSFDAATGKAAVHMVSAWAEKNRLVLGQMKVEDKSNEITAIPALLRLLDITGCIVTTDAMGCQKAIARQITEQGGAYVLALKGNHPALFEDVARFFDRAQQTHFEDIAHTFHESVHKDHGRIETRRHWLVALSTQGGLWRDVQEQWTGLKSLGMVESQRQIGDKTTTETRYFLTGLCADARLLARSVRGHWGIENRLHWVLDVVFDEDDCRIRKDNAPQNLAILRHIALNLLRQEKTCKRGVKGKRHQAAWDENYLLKVLTN